MVKRGSVVVALVLGVAPVAPAAPAAEGASKGASDVRGDVPDAATRAETSVPAWVVGGTLALGTFKGPFGPWAEISAGRDIPLSNALELRGTLGGFVTSHTRTDDGDFHESGVVEETEDKILGYGGLLRLSLGVELGGSFFARFGPLVGYAHVSMDSTQCGRVSSGNPFWGLSLGPSYRAGSLEFSAAAELVTFPFIACTNSGTNPDNADAPWPAPHFRDELSFDDPTLLLGLTMTYRFP